MLDVMKNNNSPVECALMYISLHSIVTYTEPKNAATAHYIIAVVFEYIL
jgi:hypothetical protein